MTKKIMDRRSSLCTTHARLPIDIHVKCSSSSKLWFSCHSAAFCQCRSQEAAAAKWQRGGHQEADAQADSKGDPDTDAQAETYQETAQILWWSLWKEGSTNTEKGNAAAAAADEAKVAEGLWRKMRAAAAW